MPNYIEQIAAIDAKISALSASIPAMISRSDDWRADAQNKCSGSKKKKRACEDEKARKIRLADSIMGDVAAKRSEISRLQASKQTLVDAQKAKDEATINLSTAGQSLEALVLKADGEAKAKQTQAQIEAQANAEAIKTRAQVDAQATTQATAVDLEAKKQMNMMIMAIIAVVAVIGVLFGVMKLKKMKK